MTQSDNQTCACTVRRGLSEDLEPLNHVVEQAVMSWDLPERVKRLALPSYRYHSYDLSSMTFYLAMNAAGQVKGIAALEDIDAVSGPEQSAMLLHGLYVLPECHGKGVGKQLLSVAEEHVRNMGCVGLLVKAQPEATAFFNEQGYEALAVEDTRKDYQHRLWKSLGE